MQQLLRIYNSLTRQKEVFKPLNPPFVGIYLCGPTVYEKAHIGHARTSITFDILYRYLQHLNYKVRYVRNITDVGHLERNLNKENKIVQRAKLEEISPMEIAQRYTNNYRKNMEQLNILPPSIEPYASGHIPEQITMIEKIIQNGLAYIIDGSVYFNVTKYNKIYNYGKLSRRIIQSTRPGGRLLEKQKDKKKIIDFALWKKAKSIHIMHWSSPWGEGFPGWHIECSTMSTKYLGDHFDIHGGGIDLLFPHHECEIAQVQASLKSNLAKYWIHNNLVTIDGLKMGKSLGNSITLDDLFSGKHFILDKPYNPMALRFFILQAHYRSSLSITLEGLQAAYKGYRKLINGWYLLIQFVQKEIIENLKMSSGTLDEDIYTDCIACYNAINDDLNTAKVLASLFNLLKKINGWYNGTLEYASISKDAWKKLCETYTTFLIDLLGLKDDYSTPIYPILDMVLNIYQQSKVSKKYDQIDFIRTMLHKVGISIKDHLSSIRWEYE